MSPTCSTRETSGSALIESMKWGVASVWESSLGEVPYGESPYTATVSTPLLLVSSGPGAGRSSGRARDRADSDQDGEEEPSHLRVISDWGRDERQSYGLDSRSRVTNRCRSAQGATPIISCYSIDIALISDLLHRTRYGSLEEPRRIRDLLPHEPSGGCAGPHACRSSPVAAKSAGGSRSDDRADLPAGRSELPAHEPDSASCGDAVPRLALPHREPALRERVGGDLEAVRARARPLRGSDDAIPHAAGLLHPRAPVRRTPGDRRSRRDREPLRRDRRGVRARGRRGGDPGEGPCLPAEGPARRRVARGPPPQRRVRDAAPAVDHVSPLPRAGRVPAERGRAHLGSHVERESDRAEARGAVVLSQRARGAAARAGGSRGRADARAGRGDRRREPAPALPRRHARRSLHGPDAHPLRRPLREGPGARLVRARLDDYRAGEQRPRARRGNPRGPDDPRR